MIWFNWKINTFSKNFRAKRPCWRALREWNFLIHFLHFNFLRRPLSSTIFLSLNWAYTCRTDFSFQPAFGQFSSQLNCKGSPCIQVTVVDKHLSSGWYWPDHTIVHLGAVLTDKEVLIFFSVRTVDIQLCFVSGARRNTKKLRFFHKTFWLCWIAFHDITRKIKLHY